MRVQLTHGLAGLAAKDAKDVIANDAQNHAAFLNRVDKATAFVTKSVLCVVLLQGGVTRAVVQLINKKKGEEEGAFDEADATTVREQAGPAIMTTCEGLSINQLLTQKATQA